MPYLLDPIVDAGRWAGQAQPELKSDASDLLLRPWRTADAGQLVEAFGDEKIQKWHLLRLDSTEEADAWVSEWDRRWRALTGASWAVTHLGDADVVLGQVAFRSLYLADGLAELSCWVAPAWRRKRIAAQATRRLADWGLYELGLVRLEIAHSVLNVAACRGATSAGFPLESTKRSLQRYQDGFHDMHLHVRVHDEGRRATAPEGPSTPA